MLGTVQHECYLVVGPYLVVAFYRLPVDVYETGLCGTLYAVAALVRVLFRQVLVYTYGSLPRVDLNLPVLIQFTAVCGVAAVQVLQFVDVIVAVFAVEYVFSHVVRVLLVDNSFVRVLLFSHFVVSVRMIRGGRLW